MHQAGALIICMQDCISTSSSTSVTLPLESAGHLNLVGYAVL